GYDGLYTGENTGGRRSCTSARQTSRNHEVPMFDGNTTVPTPVNEPVFSHAPGSAERAELDAAIRELKSTQHEFPMTIGGEKRRGGGDEVKVVEPHDHQ